MRTTIYSIKNSFYSGLNLSNFLKKIAPTSIFLLLGTSAFAETDGNKNSSETKKFDNSCYTQSFSAEYEIKASGVPFGGGGKRTLKKIDTNRYRLELTSSSVFLSTKEVAEFEWDKGIKPISYRYDRTGVGKDRRYRQYFHINDQRVDFEENKKVNSVRYDTVIPIDRLTETLMLQCQIAQDKKDVEILIVDRGSLKPHAFKVVGEEKISAPVGSYNAIKVERIAEKDSKRQTIMWFAPELDHQLIQMQQINNNQTFTLKLKTFKTP
ncbi:MAG: DUF3108 domain-containing protein [Pseudomonadota bacterium]